MKNFRLEGMLFESSAKAGPGSREAAPSRMESAAKRRRGERRAAWAGKFRLTAGEKTDYIAHFPWIAGTWNEQRRVPG